MYDKVKQVLVTVIVGLLACASCQPLELQEGVDEAISHILDTEWPEVVLEQGRALISEVLKLRPQDSDKETLMSALSRRGRQLEHGEGRQGTTTLLTFASSLGDLLRPAITALVGSLSMNLATSATNAVTASLGGRSLDIIPAQTFASTPAGRLIPVEQPFSELPETDSPLQVQLQVFQGLRKRPLKKRQRRHPFPTTE